MKKLKGIQFTCIDELNVDSPNYRKLSMKGGHRHNHVNNHELRLMHSKNERKCIRKFLKKDSL